MILQSSETEIASVSQQEKIKELEAQLQEAEEIVTDLRQDLRNAQGELKKRKTYQSNTIKSIWIHISNLITQWIYCSFKYEELDTQWLRRQFRLHIDETQRNRAGKKQICSKNPSLSM